MERLYIHIGAPKTGTTYIQHVLSKSAHALAAHDFVYLEASRLYAGHHCLAFAMQGEDNPQTHEPIDLAAELDSLTTEIDGTRARFGILSSEEFFICPEGAIAALRTALGDLPVTIIAFVRRSDDFLLSYHNERMKKFTKVFTHSIKDMIADRTLWPREMAFRTNLLTWARVFPETPPRVHAYEAGNPLVTLLGDLGIHSGIGIPPKMRPNRSKPAKAIALLRLLKLADWPADDRGRVCTALFDAFAEDTTPMIGPRDRARILQGNDRELSGLFESLGLEDPYADIARRLPATEVRPVTEIPVAALIDEAEAGTGCDFSNLRAFAAQAAE
ncbi:hypothetical protein Dshi_3865 (plasmid) [Dinoroseobacter shibae DFL 12 = DSM 16493]|uniref:Sulfotransferase domain-containing protein n=2 Tax=Pseudomonadota TaxID=1224 RepID=A8LTM6_DINSH|nr:hypothetical protein [Dinoroseobacter shibae]ABV95593.1 hypothetical protein Dshi_3865 [Dinoroseobacter shibae DFL 12 = DSM 16493]URF48934.1 hypothetical protein M8008_19810 [Dinoroseobacter shibae]URF53246.1 hypothetical protein M8007_19835 [Dinoroseobacter shibae]